PGRRDHLQGRAGPRRVGLAAGADHRGRTRRLPGAQRRHSLAALRRVRRRGPAWLPRRLAGPLSCSIGVNTWVWASPLDDEALARMAPRIRERGFDTIELPVKALGDWDPGRTADLLGALGLDAPV